MVTDGRSGEKHLRCAIPAHRVSLEGELALPEHALGLVVFAHGSGSSRLSPRNQAVARVLRRHGIGTLLFDLLTESEDRDRERRFDIPLLTTRLLAAASWLERQEGLPAGGLGLFGASTGAAAALEAAAELGSSVRAVVSRGGRPDLATTALPRLRAATLLLVGERDPDVLRLNEWALERMTCERRLVIVPGATHLFEEPGALERVADEAANWFVAHLSPAPAAGGGGRG